MLKSSVVKTVNFFLPAREKHIGKQSTIECTRYASAREILRNSTFPRHAAKCERAVCKQRIASSAENRCNQEQPSITPLKWCWASFMLRFGASFEDKIAYVPFIFLCRIDILRSTHHGNCTPSEHKITLPQYREKAGEEKRGGERRPRERCVNRLRFSTVSIAAAREKRESWLSRSGGLPPLFCSPFSP